jgi:hypothetical protein
VRSHFQLSELYFFAWHVVSNLFYAAKKYSRFSVLGSRFSVLGSRFSVPKGSRVQGFKGSRVQGFKGIALGSKVK